MESSNIEALLDKYFEATTSIAEENVLRNYFSGNNIVSHLEPYKSMFEYQNQEKKIEFNQKINLNRKNTKVIWFSIAASFIVLFGLITFYCIDNQNVTTNNDLGTYQDPEHAFKETQKALAMLSSKVNIGINSVEHLQEYEVAKNRVFK